ncbi:uncharacterized protein LOC128584528 [Nycticebus coucang]|uniref:uncharacterized protein LOC128584528 n=1 Tax=Nycticebus coucang TaxID=9470 RepID=UPI00234D5FA3|nr:uncharacterized protein LOC128584528 [Nycticebus coucang]XP_053445456.1 uncharacterized protein LOC128584528 [Nycticebus coucang]XP_053445457.1 uncharacterized protein LOC128584528 [Nycticebus coucang]XP_053445458.1 uncharacterized protein LOC128584528 [Nycticebus coucang]
MRSFQGHVCTGPAGVRVRECVRVRGSVRGWGGCYRGRPRASPPALLPAKARLLPPPRFPAPAARGRDPSPPPPRPHIAARPPLPPRLPRPAAGTGRSPGTMTPSHAAWPSAQRCAPPKRALFPPPPPLPDPLAPRTPSHRWPEEDLCAALPGPAPRSPLGPPPGASGSPAPRGRGGREPGGGAGGRVVPGCHFLPPPRSLRGARPPPPLLGRGGGQ